MDDEEDDDEVGEEEDEEDDGDGRLLCGLLGLHFQSCTAGMQGC